MQCRQRQRQVKHTRDTKEKNLQDRDTKEKDIKTEITKSNTNEYERHVSCLQVQESMKFCDNTFRKLFTKKYYKFRRMRDCM